MDRLELLSRVRLPKTNKEITLDCDLNKQSVLNQLINALEIIDPQKIIESQNNDLRKIPKSILKLILIFEKTLNDAETLTLYQTNIVKLFMLLLN